MKVLLPFLLLTMPLAINAQGVQHRQVSPTYDRPVPEDVATLDTIVVSGRVPGPRMWRVEDENGHVLWILGTLTPVPAEIEWDAGLIANRIAGAQELLWEPYYTVNVQAGFIRKLQLGYGILRAEGNPDGKRLEDVLPSDVYARWSRLKHEYLPGDWRIERKRPLVAASKLFQAAIRRNGLSDRKVVNAPIIEAARAHGVVSTAPKVQVEISGSDAYRVLGQARSEALDDVACMAATLDAIEQDLPRMITNANAWAIGDLRRISFASLQRREALCADAMTDTEFARNLDLPNIRNSIRGRWLHEAKAALLRNPVTVSVVPLQNIAGTHGYAAQLRAAGFAVRDP